MYKLAEKLVNLAASKSKTIATAESCTGGMIASNITAIPGSSLVFERGFITYSYESKSEILGVDANLIKRLGAVSKEVAIAMAIGALKKSNADISISITGIAGPSGGTQSKPIGLVHFAIYQNNTINSYEMHFSGDRQDIRTFASQFALQKLIEFVEKM